MNKNILLIAVCLFLLLFSCKTREKTSNLNYMQNADQIAVDASNQTNFSTIQVGDQLVILVTAKDMSVVKPFNQNYSASELATYTTGSTNLPIQGQSPTSVPTYIVDSEGNIDFPVIGKLNTSGKTMSIFKDELQDRLKKYILNPIVSMRLTNYKVTVLGEVARPGQYVIPDGNATLFNALGLAGDLTMYGKRDDILLVRNINGETTKARINLMDANFFNSPYFQLKQNDVIYVSSSEIKEKTARLDPNTSTYIAVAGTIIGLAGIFITIFKK